MEIIKKQISINAPLKNVWRVFTDPVITRQMGGEYVTDWNVGSDFGWKGSDGKMLTKGKILELIPLQLLKHNISEPGNMSKIISVITYKFHEQDQKTILFASEEINREIGKVELKEAGEGWDAALQAVKELAEKL